MNAANVIPLSTPHSVPYGSSRKRAAQNPVRVRFGAFELDEANARLSCEGTALALAPRPFGLLCALARRPGSLLTKNELLDEVWGHQFVSESVLKTAISDLRTVLDDHPKHPRFIETVSRRGYRFIAPTETISSTAAMSTSASVSTTGLQDQSGLEAWTRAVPKIAPRGRETDGALAKPVFATTEEVCYAHQLRLKLRALLLGDVASAGEPCYANAH